VTELPITQSGCYDIDIEEYHSQCCDGVSTSSSQLQKVLACPVKFWAMSDLNPKRFPEKPRKVFEIGRAAHSLVLGEPEFNKHFYVLPSDAPRRPDKSQRSAKKPSDASIKAILFWDALEQKPQALLKPEDFEIVELMALGLRLSPQVSQCLQERRAGKVADLERRRDGHLAQGASRLATERSQVRVHLRIQISCHHRAVVAHECRVPLRLPHAGRVAD
jgi:hypothetical protein